MPEETFLSMPLDAVLALGKVVVAAGRLEAQARHILLDLGQPPRKKQADEVLKMIRKCVKDGLPDLVAPHASTSPQELTAWTLEAGELLRARSEHLHAMAVQQRREDGWASVAIHLRTQRTRVTDAEDIVALATSLAKCAERGGLLHRGLLRSPRRGVLLRNAHMEGGGFWVLCVDHDIERPTEEELDAWWESMGPWWVGMDHGS